MTGRSSQTRPLAKEEERVEYIWFAEKKKGGTVWCWMVLGGTGSEQGDTGCQCDMLSENIELTRSKPSNY